MFEITITEIKTTTVDNRQITDQRIDRLKMTIDVELDIPTAIKAITIPKRKRNAKKAAA